LPPGGFRLPPVKSYSETAFRQAGHEPRKAVIDEDSGVR